MLRRLIHQLNRLLGVPGPDWDYWSEAYDFGVDWLMFESKEFCACGHRQYHHDYVQLKDSIVWNPIRPCIAQPCKCTDFKSMDNFGWIEYVKRRTAEIRTRSNKDFYDYFTAVDKGRKLKS